MYEYSRLTESVHFLVSGTFVSGLTVLCGAHVRSKGATKRGVVWVNSGVALLQFLLTFLFLLGWIWSIMWGTAFLTISGQCVSVSGCKRYFITSSS